MLQLSVLRWGQPYASMDVDQVVHFATGEPVANVGRANAATCDLRSEHARASVKFQSTT
jgi:hypothetical protein